MNIFHVHSFAVLFLYFFFSHVVILFLIGPIFQILIKLIWSNKNALNFVVYIIKFIWFNNLIKLIWPCISGLTPEEAGGKKGNWSCPDQLLINKITLEQVRNNRRNLFIVVWFDYKKAFDSA